MPSRMLPEQSRTTAIEPVPLPNWRMISSLARTATLARAGSGGAGPIATESGTTWRSTTVRREKTWPRKKPSRSRRGAAGVGVGEDRLETVRPAFGQDHRRAGQSESGMGLVPRADAR